MFTVPVDEKALPPFVQFERRAIEDRDASIKAGHYMSKDEDYALIMPRGGKDRIEKPVDLWLEQQGQLAREGRIPQDWVDGFERGYERWKRGEELTEDGTPLKTWPVASPSQIRVCLSIGITTIEQLAQANTEATTRLGLGGIALQQRARKWLEEANDIGKAVMALEKATKTVEQLTDRNTFLEGRIAQLEAAAGIQSAAIVEPADTKSQFEI